MREKFREIRLSNSNKIKLETINAIIDEYAEDDYTMTLRQLYYQLVSRDIIPNKQNEYTKISTLLKEGRMGGIVDWNAIEDRLRVPYLPYWSHGPRDAIMDTVYQYRVNRQKGQDVNIEVWVEKDALSGVLKRITQKYHVRLLVNRGYGSVTAIHDAFKRIKNKRNTCILYLGDHDPSGMDMIRDIRDRITEMLEADYYEGFFSVIPIALTTEQVREYNPPENPAKLTDPRAGWYIEKYGYSSWEVDALDPKTLNELLSSAIESRIDMDLFNEALMQEDQDKADLATLANNNF